MMAFGLEYIWRCPFVERKGERAKGMALSMVLFACLARGATIANDYSWLGYAAYLFWNLGSLREKDQEIATRRWQTTCQELLDGLNIGFVIADEGRIRLTNDKVFDLLGLERGDLTSLKELLEQQDGAKTSKFGHWTHFKCAHISRQSSGTRPARAIDKHIEYTSTYSDHSVLGVVKDEGGLRVFGLRAVVPAKAHHEAKIKDPSKLRVLTSFSHELRTSLNGRQRARIVGVLMLLPMLKERLADKQDKYYLEAALTSARILYNFVSNVLVDGLRCA